MHGVARFRFPRDPRLWQITCLSVLLVLGLSVLGFDQTPEAVAVVIAAALTTQWTGQILTGQASAGAPFDPLSPLITALSLSILLRTPSPEWMALAAVLAIGS